MTSVPNPPLNRLHGIKLRPAAQRTDCAIEIVALGVDPSETVVFALKPDEHRQLIKDLVNNPPKESGAPK